MGCGDQDGGRRRRVAIVAATLWFAPDGQPEKIYKAGESLAVPDRAIHNEGAIDKGVKLSAVYVLDKGKPLAPPAP